jgi:hypothetical protein
LDDFFDESGDIGLQSAPTPIRPSPALLGQVVRDKNFTASATYVVDLTTFVLTGRHDERIVPGLAEVDKIYSFDLEWAEIMSRSLVGRATVGFFDNYDPALGAAPSQKARAEVGFTYIYSSDITLTGSYYWNLTMREDEPDSQENIIRLGMVHAL